MAVSGSRSPAFLCVHCGAILSAARRWTAARSEADAKAADAALARGDARSAKALLDKILALQPNNTGLWLAKANAAGALGQDGEKSEAIDRALAIDPSSLQALIAKADHLTEAGDLRGASAYYRTALRYMPRFGQLPVAAQQGLLRAAPAHAQCRGQRVPRRPPAVRRDRGRLPVRR